MTRRRQHSAERRRKRAALVRAQAGRCHFCAGYVRDDVDQNHPHRATLHRISRADGTRWGNVVAACRGCNVAHGDGRVAG